MQVIRDDVGLFFFLIWIKQRADIREAREYYKESGDVDGILKKLPRFLVAERAVVSCHQLTEYSFDWFLNLKLAIVWNAM